MKKLICVLFSLFLLFYVASCGEKTIKVTINGVDGNTFIEVVEGEKLEKPDVPVKEGYNFEGWYADENFQNEWDFENSIPTSETIIYARWSLTVGEAIKIASSLAKGEKTEERYLVRGTIESIKNPTYGSMTITDETGSISVYGSYGSDGELRYDALEEKPFANDSVLLYSILQNYNGTAEIYSGWIMEFDHVEEEIDESDYKQMNITDIRNAESGTLVKTTGVVARITYANGYIPNGFYLVDNTNSIYVFDSQVAARVEIGNKVTLIGEKTYWILDTEINNANKFGYKGCNQIANVTLLSNDEKTTNEFDKSWITSSTVKKMMDTKASVDITTTIFKVNALVKKQEGHGFTNYYFYDLDGTTGSYTYTQCSGGDFSWLDEFDGKICTVYLSALNAKSTASGCNWRFVPILVIDDNFTFNIEDASKFAVDYFGLTQFETNYTGDPYLELVSTVSSELLGFDDAVLNYSSSNENIIYFENVEGMVYMRTLNPGTAIITVKGTYNSVEYANTIEITVNETPSYDALTVKQAIDSELDTIVTVKGIVGPSLVNQVGFYLIDETGVIAIKTDADTMSTLKLGQEVVMKGNRVQYKADGCAGQTCLLDSELVANLYGKHEYSTTSFITDEMLEDIVDLPKEENYTTNVYVLEAQVKFVETNYYSNAYLVYGDVELLLYTSSGNQYSWLKEYIGQTITVEVALCNWNGKGYRGCVLSAVGSDGVKVYNELNFNK